MIVRMFKPQFAGMVERGEKNQTVRKTPKLMPKAGDTISLRTWTGLPYRSKQRHLAVGTVTNVIPVEFLSSGGIKLDGKLITLGEECEFARADGFKDKPEMIRWFESEHSLPFSGIVIYWKQIIDTRP